MSQTSVVVNPYYVVVQLYLRYFVYAVYLKVNQRLELNMLPIRKKDQEKNTNSADNDNVNPLFN